MLHGDISETLDLELFGKNIKIDETFDEYTY
jgi:hypothetical protein